MVWKIELEIAALHWEKVKETECIKGNKVKSEEGAGTAEMGAVALKLAMMLTK